MNERIRQLADRCFSTLPHEDELEKFAELIVRECAHKVTLNEARNIFEHFGVE